MPVMSVAKELVRMAVCDGYGDEDVCSVVKCYEDWARITVQKEQKK
jgi:2-hydroxy-3-oxopropionate reductase